MVSKREKLTQNYNIHFFQIAKRFCNKVSLQNEFPQFKLSTLYLQNGLGLNNTVTGGTTLLNKLKPREKACSG